MNLTKSQPAPEPADESFEATSSGPNKLLLIGGGVVALGAAGALAFVLLSGGDDVPEGPVAAAPHPVATADPAATDTATPSTSASIPTYAAKNARDPFKALVTEGSGGGGSASSTAPAAPSVPSTNPTTVPSWTPPASTPSKTTKPTKPSSSPSTSTSTPPADPEPSIPYDVHIVVLNKIVDDSTIDIYADDQLVTLKVGEASGPLELKSVDQTAKTATVQYGEVAVTLTLRQVVILQDSGA
jgi:hypothetical protein